MPARFDDAIPFSGDLPVPGDWVVAIGPEHPKEKINEICVWVYQSLPDGAGDAAATEMTTHTEQGHGPHFLQVDGGRWLLPLKRISTAPFRNGRAFAVAIALIAEREGEKEHVVWWSQPVELQENKDRAGVAVEAVHIAAERVTEEAELAALAKQTLGKGGPLADPLKFTGDS
jgi:hypothetical protein